MLALQQEKKYFTMSNTFLIVDDDQTFRGHLTQALIGRGYAANGAGSASEALELLKSHAFDYAIIDQRMPGGSGIEVVKRAKELQVNIKILVLTGFGSIAAAVEAVKLGACDYLTKPADLDSILDALGFELAQPINKPADLVPSLWQSEWEYLQRVLAETQGNISRAAQKLGLHRRSLQRKLKKGPPS